MDNKIYLLIDVINNLMDESPWDFAGAIDDVLNGAGDTEVSVNSLREMINSASKSESAPELDFD